MSKVVVRTTDGLYQALQPSPTGKDFEGARRLLTGSPSTVNTTKAASYADALSKAIKPARSNTSVLPVLNLQNQK